MIYDGYPDPCQRLLICNEFVESSERNLGISASARVHNVENLAAQIRRTAKLKKYQPYLNYLAAYGTDPIYDLAYSLGISREQAVKDLSDMIGSKIINASISDDDYIVLASNPAKIPSRSRYAKKFIRCPFCGAPNTIGPEEPRKCAYCDSPLE